MKDEAFRQTVLPDRASAVPTRKLLEPGLTAQMGSHAVHGGAIIISCSLSLSQELLALYTKKGMAAHASILVWRVLWTEEPGGLTVQESQRVVHD